MLSSHYGTHPQSLRENGEGAVHSDGFPVESFIHGYGTGCHRAHDDCLVMQVVFKRRCEKTKVVTLVT